MVDRLRAVVPFPVAGEGIGLKFSNSACAELQVCVELGAVKDGKPTKVEFDNIDVPLMQIAESVLDALYMSVHGMTFGDYLIELGKRAEAIQAAENPTNVSSPDNISAS